MDDEISYVWDENLKAFVPAPSAKEALQISIQPVAALEGQALLSDGRGGMIWSSIVHVGKKAPTNIFPGRLWLEMETKDER